MGQFCFFVSLRDENLPICMNHEKIPKSHFWDNFDTQKSSNLANGPRTTTLHCRTGTQIFKPHFCIEILCIVVVFPQLFVTFQNAGSEFKFLYHKKHSAITHYLFIICRYHNFYQAIYIFIQFASFLWIFNDNYAVCYFVILKETKKKVVCLEKDWRKQIAAKSFLVFAKIVQRLLAIFAKNQQYFAAYFFQTSSPFCSHFLQKANRFDFC